LQGIRIAPEFKKYSSGCLFKILHLDEKATTSKNLKYAHVDVACAKLVETK